MESANDEQFYNNLYYYYYYYYEDYNKQKTIHTVLFVMALSTNSSVESVSLFGNGYYYHYYYCYYYKNTMYGTVFTDGLYSIRIVLLAMALSTKFSVENSPNSTRVNPTTTTINRNTIIYTAFAPCCLPWLHRPVLS